MSPPATVAVVVNTHNDLRWLHVAIDSVLAQTRAADDIIVVDDGSVEDPTPVVAAFHGTRLIRQANAGLAAARNTGTRTAETEYILFLDADDRLEPRAIETGLACFERKPHSGFVYGGHRTINADGSRRDPDRFTPVGDSPYRDLLRGNLVAMHATVLYRRERLIAAGGFDSGLRRCEDYDLYLRMARQGPIGCHPEIVAEYRWHDRNMSRDHRAMLRTVLAVHRRQETFAQKNSDDHAAWRAGRRGWRGYYAAELAAEIRCSLPARGRMWRVLRALPILLRMSPRWTLGELARTIGRRGPHWFQHRTLRVLRRRGGERKPPSTGHVNFGDLGTTTPISLNFGFDRGLPIDRYYIEGFLDRNRDDIRGRVLEIGDDGYSRKYGGARISRQDILHVHSGNPNATIVGELADEELLEHDAFDCVVLTQTLHLIWDMKLALQNVRCALKPGGTALLTVPGVTSVDRAEWGNTWYWSLTKAAAERLAGEVFGADNVRVEAHGNVFAATVFLHGIALGEVDRGALDVVDTAYPVIVAVHARKAGG